jgi:DNA-binding transcriptional LysR family regulator
MSDIENRLLRYFVAVAEEQHFARAAERLGITPQTLTPQIQKLESDLGAKLLQRRGSRQVVVTEAGRRFLARSREILRQVEEAAAIARQAGRGELGRLELGFVISVSCADSLRRWISAFEQAHPAIDMTMYKLAPTAQIAGIKHKELDAGFTRTPRKYPTGVRGFEIYRQPLVLALPSEHPLARHKAISPAMLAGEAFVSTTTELDLAFSGHIETIARIGRFVPRVVKREDDFIAVLTYVGLGRGITVVPENVKKVNLSNVVFRDIAADPVPQTSIAFVYDSNPSPSAKLLIQHMRRHALRNHGKGATPPRNHGRTMIPSALNLDPHPKVRAKRASKDEAEALGPVPSTLGVARRAPPGEEMSQR